MTSPTVTNQNVEEPVEDQTDAPDFSMDDLLPSSPLSSVPSDFDRDGVRDSLPAAPSPSQRTGDRQRITQGKHEASPSRTDQQVETKPPPESHLTERKGDSPEGLPLAREEETSASALEGDPPDFQMAFADTLKAESPANVNGETGPTVESSAKMSPEEAGLNEECRRPPHPPSSPAAPSRKRSLPPEYDEQSGSKPVYPPSSPSKKQRMDIQEPDSGTHFAASEEAPEGPGMTISSSPPSVIQTAGTEELDTPSGRPSRKRAAPTRYTNEPEAGSKSAKKSRPNKPGDRSLRKNCWNADHLLQSPKSKLVYANLFGVLSDERAWTLLSPEEQRQLLAMLPEPVVTETSEGETLPNVLQEYLKNNNAFQADVRLFQEDLSAGRYEPKWLADAKAAMAKRAEGKFDSWKEQQTEAFWGQKQKLYHSVIAGDSSTCKLATLVEADCFKIGDIWLYSKIFGRVKANSTLVEKEAKIINISPTKRLSFSFPPEQHKFSSSANGTDLVLKDISGPQPLVNAILKEDGRITDPPNGNAWKEIRCWRDNQDIGSIWEIREAYHVRSNGIT